MIEPRGKAVVLIPQRAAVATLITVRSSALDISLPECVVVTVLSASPPRKNDSGRPKTKRHNHGE